MRQGNTSGSAVTVGNGGDCTGSFASNSAAGEEVAALFDVAGGTVFGCGASGVSLHPNAPSVAAVPIKKLRRSKSEIIAKVLRSDWSRVLRFVGYGVYGGCNRCIG